MKSYRIEQRVPQVSAAHEMQSLAPRQDRDSMPETGSQVFAICARIGVGLLYAACAFAAVAQSPADLNFHFRNVVDNRQTLSGFNSFPAINDSGAVVFTASEAGVGQGVFKWKNGAVTRIASSGAGVLSGFGNAPVIDAHGRVAFDADVSTGGRSIFLQDDTSSKTIVNTQEQGLIARFLGAPSINREGTVAFFGARTGFTSQAIFAGDGGPLRVVVDTANSDFTGFQNAAINSTGKVVFIGDRLDGSEGMFIADSRNVASPGSRAQPIDVVDTNNPDFIGFGDPVINYFGIVADEAFRSDGSVEILSGTQHRVTARTDVANPVFTEFEHPSINDEGAVAFFAVKSSGVQGIYMEVTGGASPVPVVQTGDTLFGSTVTFVDLGRFALNVRFQAVFAYELADGRTGIAIASLGADRDSN